MRNLTQDITRWTVTPDGFGGFTFGVPQAIKGRWQDVVEVFVDMKGQEKVGKSIVYLDTDVAVEDFLFQGASTVADPTTLDSHQVQRFDKIADLRNADNERKAYL